MLHFNFLYRACRNYSGGLSTPDLLDKSVLFYGKPGSGKKAALGVRLHEPHIHRNEQNAPI